MMEQARTRLGNVIDGRTVAAEHSIPFFNPATGEQIGMAPNSSPAEVDAAVAAAAGAFTTWKKTSPSQRQKALLDLADLIEENVEYLLDIEQASTGKPREVTRVLEVMRSADQLRFFAGAARVVSGTAQADYQTGFTSAVRREPLGVVAQITPWNYPLMMAVWKIGPALAAGNTVVIKPAESTPWSTVVLAELAQQVLPTGVLNVVCGSRETGAALVEHPTPALAAITGSTRAGREVMLAAAGTLKDVHLELGGKAPAIVFGDVDVASTVAQIATSSFFNAGQDCTAIARILVQDVIHDEFVDQLAAAADGIRIGGPDDASAAVGPLNSVTHLDRVKGFIDRLPEHAQICAGGVARGPGYFFAPTVISGVGQNDEVVREEVFGPVVTVQPFATEDEAVSLANDSPYGLASSVWARDIGVVNRVVAELDFGTVWVNCHQVLPAETPHGGFKQSGTGKDLSLYALEGYSRVKSVTMATS